MVWRIADTLHIEGKILVKLEVPGNSEVYYYLAPAALDEYEFVGCPV